MPRNICLALPRFGTLFSLTSSVGAEVDILFILSGCCYPAAWQYPWHLPKLTAPAPASQFRTAPYPSYTPARAGSRSGRKCDCVVVNPSERRGNERRLTTDRSSGER